MKFIKRQELKKKPESFSELGFGKIFTDYMFIMEYDNGEWKNHRIEPHGPLSLDPAAKVLHYGQELFEGMKAYYAQDGRVLVFRAKDNFKRMNEGAERICLPKINEQEVFEAFIELLKIEKEWVPKQSGTSLYARPTLFGIDPQLGVDAAQQVLFYIILSPSGAYYSTGINPVKIYVEQNYVRAVRGGMGAAKTGGNYAASIKAGVVAKKQGYNQVLWLDGIEKKYIEEVGAMNMFFLFNDELTTPELGGSILDGITRRSVIELAREKNIKVVERKISMEEVYERAQKGELLEAFGSGTAAVVSPVGEIAWGDKKIIINNGEIGKVTQSLYDELTGIQTGRIEDTHGWITQIK